MHLTFVPLLEEERELYRRPRDFTRFKAYLRWTIDWEAERVKLPTVMMNPMARDHVAAYLDALLALDAEAVGAAALREAAPALADVPGTFRVALVVCDDVAGGWTNRYACEYALMACAPPPRCLEQFDWHGVVLWAGDAPSARLVREAVLTTLYRVAYVHRHGPPRTLRDVLAQEGWVLARAGCDGPTLDADDIEYTRYVLGPHLDATDLRTWVECLFGDAAGRTLGFTARGLSPRAGLAVARHDALA